MDDQDLFPRFDGDNSTGGSSILGGIGGDGEDPFNGSGTEFFDKLLADEEKNGSKGMLITTGNDSSINAQSLLDGVLNNSSDSINIDMELEGGPAGGDVEGGSNIGMQNATFDTAHAPAVKSNPLLEAAMAKPGGGQGMFNVQPMGAASNASFAVQTNKNLNPMLDASPLNVSIGMGGCGGIASTLRRSKGSNAKLSSTNLRQLKGNAAIKANVSSSRLKPTKSDGLLARALKAKYNSSNSVNKYNVNAAGAAAVINARVPRNAVSAIGISAALRSNNSMFRARGSNASFNMTAVEEQGSTQNASWGAASSQRKMGNASLFSKILSTPGSNSNLAGGSAASDLLRSKMRRSSGSRTSMQDILRMGRSQSKTQSMLRQSSAHSLAKQASSQNVKEIPKKLDVSSLLPPQHTASGQKKIGLNNGSNANASMDAQSSVPTPSPAAQQGGGGNFETSNLLHQSCRLYPTTAPVVESALRIDPGAVRRPVAVQAESGGQAKKSQKQNVYGYPVNVAMTHGATLEVLNMLVEAGPDVLVQKDGTTGSGSLGIALSHKCDVAVLNLLVEANPKCVTVSDRRGNYPLHVAVSQAFPIEVVKRLYSIYPKALQMKNFHSETPLDIAQRSTRCPEEVMNFLQSASFNPLEAKAYHFDQTSSDLEDGLDDIMQTNF